VFPLQLAFTAELEEGYESATSVSFGGGDCGYAFTCPPCTEAAFVWQR
jgi:hypothetical protein